MQNPPTSVVFGAIFVATGSSPTRLKDSEMSVFDNHKNGGFSGAELRAVERNVLGGPRVLWAGVLAVLLPLAILLGLQYWWLTDLEHNSAIARKAALDNYLDAISKEVHYFYFKISERALNLPPEALGPKSIKKAGRLLQEEGDRRRQEALRRQLPDPGLHLLLQPRRPFDGGPGFLRRDGRGVGRRGAVGLSEKKGAKIDTTNLSVDQRDPDNRIILNPIVDDNWKLIGLAGLIVDQEFFENEVLPKVDPGQPAEL